MSAISWRGVEHWLLGCIVAGGHEANDRVQAQVGLQIF